MPGTSLDAPEDDADGVQRLTTWEDDGLLSPPTRTAAVGGLMAMPAAMLVTAGSMDAPLPTLVTHPILVLGGLGFALLLNLAEILRFEFAGGDGFFEGHLEVQLHHRTLNLAVIALSTMLTGIIGVYVVGENLLSR